MPSFCGLRFFGRKRTLSLVSGTPHEDVEEQPRPYSGSTAVGTSSGDTGTDEKVLENRSRSRSVSQRLTVSAGAFTSALRDRARSRSRGKSLSQPTTPLVVEDEKVPALPVKDDTSLVSLDTEKATHPSLTDEKTPAPAARDDKPPRLELDLITITGPAWPLNDDKDDEKSSDKRSSGSTAKRTNSVDTLDTPISPPDSPAEEKKRVVDRLSTSRGDPNRDSKLKDEGLVEDVPETEEQRRKRKMRESRQRLADMNKDEQERLDMFQCF